MRTGNNYSGARWLFSQRKGKRKPTQAKLKASAPSGVSFHGSSRDRPRDKGER